MIEVAYTLQDGKERVGSLSGPARENAKTLMVYPYRWIKCLPIKVHKVKNRVRILDRQNCGVPVEEAGPERPGGGPRAGVVEVAL
jgi:hypothetical protein